MMISAIVAMAQNGVIGIENRLPWKLSGDLKKFKELTTGHHILMGRKTFESLGRPLPHRTHLVITSLETIPGTHTFTQISSAVDFARDNGESELFIIGGAQIYQSTLSLVNRLYMTKVLANVEGDAHFTDVDWGQWNLVTREEFPQDDKNQYAWAFEVWDKKA